MLCPACGATCSHGARHCPICGVRLSELDLQRDAPSLLVQGTPLPVNNVPLLPGTLLQGRYRIESVLGIGAFGRVYRAEDVQDTTAPALAIKELLDPPLILPMNGMRSSSGSSAR